MTVLYRYMHDCMYVFLPLTMELNPRSQMSQTQLMELVKEPAVRVDGYESRLSLADMGAPVAATKGGAEHPPGCRSGLRDESSLDQSMDSHFSFIQDVSAPQEMGDLLPKLHATLAQVRVGHQGTGS